jgi:hypothetical protein
VPDAAEDSCGVVAMNKAAVSGRKSFRMDDLLTRETLLGDA